MQVCWVYLMKDKSQTNSIFQQSHKSIPIVLQKSIQILCTNNGKEYMSHDFQKFLSNHSIFHQTYHAYTPQQNSLVERKNMHL